MAKQINAVLKLKDQFSSPLKNCSKIVEKTGKGMQVTANDAKILGTSFKKSLAKGAKVAATAVVGAGTAVAVASKKIVDSTISQVDAIDKASQKIGISTKAYQEWDYALGQSGVKTSVLKSGVKKLTTMMQSASEGTESAVSAFDRLGVSIYDSSGKMKSQEQMLSESIIALSNMENSSERAALATEVLGKAGTELAPLLNSGADGVQGLIDRAHELGLVIDDETIASGVKLGDTMDDVKQSFGRVTTIIGAQLIPIFQQGTDYVLSHAPQIQEAAGKVGEIITQKVAPAVTWAIEHARQLATGAGVVIGVLAGFKVINTIIAMVNTAKTVIAAFKAVQAATNITLLSCPITWIVVGITAVIAVVVIVIKKFGSFKNAINALMEKFPGLKAAFEGFKTVIQALTTPITAVVNGLKKIFGYDGKKVSVTQETTKVTRGNATGNSYFPGGLTRINEGGRGEVVNLPSGSKIVPASKVGKQNNGGKTVNVNISVQGNMIGNEAAMEAFGSYIGSKILDAMSNV